MRLVVVDLDGTLIAGNSFHLWLRFLTLWALRNGRLRVLAGVMSAVVLRLLRRTSHAQLKRSVLLLSADVPIGVTEVFAQRVTSAVRPDVRSQVAVHAADGLSVVLVTAAPDFYLSDVAAALSADAVVGTPSAVNAGWKEVVGESKWSRLTDLYGSDVVIEVVYTDHADDLPLVLRANRAVIVDPSAASWDAFLACGTPVTRMAVTP